MQYIGYRESANHGSSSFPVAFYHFDVSSVMSSFPYHWHPEWEIIHVINGTLNLTSNGHTYAITTGSYYLISSGTLHSGEWTDCEYESIVFDFNSIAGSLSLSDSFNHLHMKNDINTVPAAVLVCDQLFNMIHNSNMNKFIFIGLLFSLFGELDDAGFYKDSSEDSLHFYKLSESIKPALLYIENHYSEDISLDVLAKTAGFNKKYFCKIFKSLTLKTPFEYLNFYRVNVAKRMLSDNPYISVSETGYLCGYNDPAYFIRIFKKITGTTPAKYQSASFKSAL